MSKQEGYWKYCELLIIIYSNIREKYSKFSKIKQNLIVILATIAMFWILIRSSSSELLLQLRRS